jgi:hypothetical protein
MKKANHEDKSQRENNGKNHLKLYAFKSIAFIKAVIIKLKKHYKNNIRIYKTFYKISLFILFIVFFIVPLAGTVNIAVENELNLDESTLLKEKLDYLFNSNEKRINAIIRYCKRHNIPPLFAASVIYAESSNKKLATSYVNARGLMQLMSKTAIALAKATGDKKLAKAIEKNPNLLYDADLNIFLGTYFLKDLSRQFGGNWQKALHAYNVGPYAFKLGKRNPYYVNRIMRFYSDWTGMNLEQIHAKYSKMLFNLYKPKTKIIGPE